MKTEGSNIGVQLLVIRHGKTDWNEQHRIQGSTDTDLTRAARAGLERCRLPHDCDDWRWVSSPLGRARQTAAALGGIDVEVDARIREMSWGEWEGQTLAHLRRTLGSEMERNERRGLDFRPPGGESPRDVQQRLESWLDELEIAAMPVVAVTHKGVIRALLALATGWDMKASPTQRIDWDRAQLFSVQRGSLRLSRINIELVAR